MSVIPKVLYPRSSPAPQHPLGLSPDQVDSLLSLRAHPGWAHYQQALGELAAIQAKPLLSGLLEHERYLFQAGVFEAFRRIIALPDTLANQRSHDRSVRADAALDPNLALNTPWYDASRRNGAPK